MTYPDTCIRGISKSDCLTEEKAVAHRNLFPFHKKNLDGWLEESINWNDDTSVIRFTLDQKNDTDASNMFEVGIAIINRDQIDLIIRRRGISDRFKYERKPIEKPPNPYHGNLLLKNDTPNQLKESIRTHLAFISEIHLRDEFPPGINK